MIKSLVEALIQAYIIGPIRRLWNFFVGGKYIPDNERNREILDYFIKIVTNPQTQPETPLENYIEAEIKGIYDRRIAEGDCDLNDPFFAWENARSVIAAQLAEEMFKYRWVEED